MNARKSQAYKNQASSTYHGDLLHLDRKLNQPCALHAAAKLLCTGKPTTYKSLRSTYVKSQSPQKPGKLWTMLLGCDKTKVMSVGYLCTHLGIKQQVVLILKA